MFIFLTPFEVDWERIFVFFNSFFVLTDFCLAFSYSPAWFFNDFIFSVLFAVPQYFWEGFAIFLSTSILLYLFCPFVLPVCFAGLISVLFDYFFACLSYAFYFAWFVLYVCFTCLLKIVWDFLFGVDNEGNNKNMWFQWRYGFRVMADKYIK